MTSVVKKCTWGFVGLLNGFMMNGSCFDAVITCGAYLYKGKLVDWNLQNLWDIWDTRIHSVPKRNWGTKYMTKDGAVVYCRDTGLPIIP